VQELATFNLHEGVLKFIKFNFTSRCRGAWKFSFMTRHIAAYKIQFHKLTNKSLQQFLLQIQTATWTDPPWGTHTFKGHNNRTAVTQEE
jgi:hypothetical protein